MGCDIHAHSEIKIDGTWHHLSQLAISRNYDLFSKMAGVRSYENSSTPIALPRGLPDDITFLTRFDNDHWGTDGHSHSWLSAAEVVELGNWLEEEHKKYSPEYFYYEKVFGYIFGNGWESFTKYREALPDKVTDARVVFWFDN